VLRRTGYVLEDASMYGSPKKWARRVVEMALKHDAVVRAEQNQGGAMVREVIHGINPEIRVELVTATVSKMARAEPVAMAHQQGRLKWAGRFAELEDQWTTWVPADKRKDESPDRIDAMVHGFTGVISLAKKAAARAGGKTAASNPGKGKHLDIRGSGGRARR
jgi:phage terminase large subunit-like protein